MTRIKDKSINKFSSNKVTKASVTFEKQHDQRVNEEDESSVNSNENIQNVENIENQQEMKFSSTHDNRYSKLLSSAKEYQHPRHESEVKYIQSSPLRNARFSSSPLANDMK